MKGTNPPEIRMPQRPRSDRPLDERIALAALREQLPAQEATGHPFAGRVLDLTAGLPWTRFEELPDRAGFQRRFDHLTDVAELDPPLSRSWSTVRVVDYWLWAVGQGFTEDAEKCSTLLGWLGPRP